MTTARFRILRSQITSLRRNLLPHRFDPTGTYRPAVYEKSRAFHVLVHAEFEAFVEDRVKEVVLDHLARWNGRRESSRVIAGLLAFNDTSFREIESLAHQKGGAPEFLGERVGRAAQAHIQYTVGHNHGVAEKYLLKMLLPIGFDENELDDTWIADLNSWANVRGGIAHGSRHRVQQTLDPQREYNDAKKLLKGFEKLDRSISRLA